jgi:fimbrial chaperone protein
LLLVAVAAAAASPPAAGGTRTATFQVNAAQAADCTIDARNTDAGAGDPPAIEATTSATPSAPCTVQMAPTQALAPLTLRNEGNKTLQAVVRVFVWSQDRGADRLEPTQALFASPPTIELAPGGAQTLQLVRTLKSTPSREESYRVVVEEITDVAAPSQGGTPAALQHSLPVFAAPTGMKPPRVIVTATVDGQAVHLKATNEGGQHANVSAVSVQRADGSSVMVDPGLVGYVLVGQSMDWTLKLPSDSEDPSPYVSLHCRFNGEDFSEKL